MQIDVPGTPFRSAKLAKAAVLDIIQENVVAARERAVAGDWGTGRRSALQNYLFTKVSEGDEIESVAALSVRSLSVGELVPLCC